MIRFDSDSIYDRIISKLQQSHEWRALVNNSVIQSLVRSNSEADAETARYAEYLFKESRWDTAQNTTSVVAMANMLGYQPKRKISSQGKIYVSFDAKTTSVGNSITMESFLNLNKDTPFENALRNSWRKPSSPVIINATTKVKDSEGISYVVTSPAIIEANDYYTSVDIMQGEIKSKFIDIDTIRSTYSISKLNPYMYIPVSIRNCEAASSAASKQFLSVNLIYPDNSNSTQNEENNSSETQYRYEPYRVVDSLLLSSEGDKDVEFYNDLYNQNLFYLKFKNDPLTENVIDLSQNSSLIGIRIDYIESLGKESNKEDLHKAFYLEDATMGSARVKLYGINYTALSGGSDEESVTDIKKNAVKEYTKYYSIGTKEAYQNAILNTVFKVNIGGVSKNIIPKKVQVYGGVDSSTNSSIPVTYVSFIAGGLDDISIKSSSDNPYEDIETSLNYALARLKSPQDTLRFAPPSYTSFALGIECTINSNSSNEISSLSNQISDFIDLKWGPNSNDIDFGRNFSVSSETTALTSKFDIEITSLEVEAVKKLEWENAMLESPNGDQNSAIHTFRIPFEFSTVFLGNQVIKGFKDYDMGAKYVMRVDFLYKTPSTLGTITNLSKSLFISTKPAVTQDIINANSVSRGSKSFCILSEGSDSESTWPDINNLMVMDDYNDLADADVLSTAYLVDFKKKVYTDNGFTLLENDIKNHKVALRNSTSKGAIDNYLIYFSGNYDTEQGGEGNIGAGWIELTFDEIYSVIQTFALYDSKLASKLNTCTLNALKCNVSDQNAFMIFKDIMSNYLDIYVSMRPVDQNLSLISNSLSDEKGYNGSNEILYIDSYDSEILETGAQGEKVTNLTSDKKSRFISIDCSYRRT